jgi:hypothetical protein
MRRSVIGVGLVLAWLGLAGCSSKPPPKRDPPVEVYLRRIYQAYDIAMYKLGHPPRNEDELRRFLGETGAMEDPEQLLVSPRDGQKYVIHYGPRLEPYGGEILAHEKDGVDGTRYILLTSCDVRVMKDEDFARKYPDKGPKAKAK